MSIKQPKPLQIRLPFSVPRPNKSTNTDKKICGICRKNESKYVCPRCNVLYCSLDCFRDESHSQCSEPFYKSTVLSSIASDPKAGLEEKKSMVEMLRRFEETQAEGGEGSEDFLKELEELEKEEEEYDELLEKLNGVDLDSIDSNQLFHLLPQQHRDAFLQALKNPDSEEAKSLLEEATKDQNRKVPEVLPWWEEQQLDNDEEVDLDDHEDQEKRKGLQTAPSPALIPDQIVDAISPPEGVGNKLVYNAIALCIAYLHTLLSFRLPSLSSSYLVEADLTSQEIKESIGKLVPFLVDPKSTVRYENPSSAWGNVWDKIVDDLPPDQTNLSTLHHLLSLLSALIHPPIAQPSLPKLFYILSDLYGLYSIPKAGGAVPRKLAFYFKALRSLSRSEWLSLEKQLERELDRVKSENDNDSAQEPQDRRELKVL
ncbi:hypothetical protein I302_101492 [Kwoniella bestiolae CBS 10118]|uniref:HIT-type domain-containing protein n=1 Tax=Kwoniella bestiolae CBS 10118 TaxID=1296100 RepID=A0A1B9GCD1_9TREE|nr:hypothetical protein I302_00175 [Kwoniella bestiolae CBS 10118]OCF28686.1 hypothetical protein I302_00175 [Kwoniella bestiolae CBS 10118]